MCIGYGFNDSHIQHILFSQITTGRKFIVVITQKSVKYLRMVEDINMKKYLIFEENSIEQRVISNNEDITVRVNIYIYKIEFINIK